MGATLAKLVDLINTHSERTASDTATTNEGSSTVLTLGLVAYTIGIVVGIFTELTDTIAGWNTAQKAVYLAMVVLTIVLLGVSAMAAGWPAEHRFMRPKVSAHCSKLSAILASALLVVAIACKLRPWGCVAGVPSAAAVAGIMVVVWMWAEPKAREAVCGYWNRVMDLPGKVNKCLSCSISRIVPK